MGCQVWLCVDLHHGGLDLDGEPEGITMMLPPHVKVTLPVLSQHLVDHLHRSLVLKDLEVRGLINA